MTGLLWFDNDPRRKPADKIAAAATRYAAKFGQRPTVCHVNEADAGAGVRALRGVRVVVKGNALRHHYFVGVE